MAHVDIQLSTIIERPIELVARYAADPSNAPEWYANISSVEWKTPKPLTVGSRLAFVANFLGRRIAYTYEVMEWVPQRRLVMRTAQGPFPMETTYEWRELPTGRTEMSLRNRGTPSGFSKLFAPFMGFAVQRANRKDLAALKAILVQDPVGARSSSSALESKSRT